MSSLLSGDADDKIDEHFRVEKLKGNYGTLGRTVDFGGSGIVERDFLILKEIYDKYNIRIVRDKSKDIIDQVLLNAFSDRLGKKYYNISEFAEDIMGRGIILDDKKVSEIRLEHLGHFGKVPEGIGYFSDLKKFSYMAYSGEGLKDAFHDNFSGLKKLEEIFFYRFNMEKIHDEIVRLPNLKSLAFQNYVIDEISENISECRNLERLVVNSCTPHNSTFKISSEIGNLEKLKHLGLSGNWIYELPKEILDIDSLESLSIGGCGFEKEGRSYEVVDSLIEKGVRVFER